MQGATTTLDALYLRVEQGDPTALPGILAAQRACTRAAVSSEAGHPGNQRPQWLHRQELPNPFEEFITHRLPRAARTRHRQGLFCITFCCGTKEPLTSLTLTDWPAKLATLRERFTKLAEFQKKLSAFGRGFGSAASSHPGLQREP